MRTFGKITMAMGLVACMGLTASAQGPGGGGRGGMMGGPGGGNLLSNTSVQKELKLSEEQVEKVKKVATEMMEKSREKMQDIMEMEQGPERQAKMTAVRKEITAEAKKHASKILSSEQLKRFEEITYQVAGPTSIVDDEELQKKLKVTPEQVSKIKEINTAMMSERRELMQGMQDDREGTMKKMTSLTKETHEKAAGVLTSEQKSTWKELTGTPFEIKMEPGMRGGNQRRPA